MVSKHVYHKPTLSGVYSNINTFISEGYKVGFHSEVCHLKEILKKNVFPIKLIDSCIKNFLNKRLTEKSVTLTAKKKDLVIVLPFLGKLSFDLKTCLKKKSISKNLPFCKIRVIFKSSTHISNFFQFKDKMHYCLYSNIIYKFLCGRCNVTYYDKTCQHLSIRVSEHLGVSPLNGKKSKSKKYAAVKYHTLFCNHIVSTHDFTILATSD